MGIINRREASSWGINKTCNYMNTFGNFIRAARESKGLNLKSFAQLLGLSSAFWSRIETGRENPPKDEHILRCAEVLGLPTDDLFIAASRIPPDLRPNLRDVVRVFRQSQA